MTRNAPTTRILKNDYPSLLMIMAIVIAWVLAIVAFVFRTLPGRGGGGMIEIDNTMLMVMGSGTIVLTVLLGWFASRRISGIKRVVSAGQEVVGQIQSIGFHKDRGRVEYAYELDGKSYHAGNAIWKNRETKLLNSGDEIVLIVDPEDPSRAFIASLYT